MIVQDLRGKNRRAEANAHTEILERILESRKKHRILNKIVGATGNVYYMAQSAAAGYLAGYVASGGDIDTATQCAEYSMVLWAGLKLGIELPLMPLIKRTHRNCEDKLDKERMNAEELEEKGQFNRYKPKEGLDFKNHKSNYEKTLENSVQKQYWGNLETARKPVRRTISNCLYGALGFGIVSMIVDGENDVINWVGPNPIERGLELTHYLFGQITPLKDYLTQNTHEHVGNFNQLQMVGVGLVGGLLNSARQFMKGKYQQIMARLKSEKKE